MLCASFHSHWSIQTGVTVRKRPNQGTICFDLCDLGLWPWPFAWTSPLSMVITSENFMMIQWQEHCEKGVTDKRTDGRTEVFLKLLGRSQKWPSCLRDNCSEENAFVLVIDIKNGWYNGISIRPQYVVNYNHWHAMSWLCTCVLQLTQLPLDKMAAISQTTVLNALSWMKSF